MGKILFYLPAPNDIGRCFINIAFDIHEIKRRQLEKKITALTASGALSESTLTFLFNGEIKKLNDTLKIFYREVRMGEDLANFIKMEPVCVFEQTGVDNITNLAYTSFDIKQKALVDKQNPFSKHRFYNVGTALLMLKLYDAAIEHFNLALNSGDKDACVYYNRALAYFYKGNKPKAQEDWNAANQLGDKEAGEMLAKYYK